MRETENPLDDRYKWFKKDVVIMAEENEKRNDIGLTEEDYQPSIEGKEEFYGNLLKFPACRELEEYLKQRNTHRIDLSKDISCTELINKIPRLIISENGVSEKNLSSPSRGKSVLFSDVYFYLIVDNSHTLRTTYIEKIGIIDRDIGMDSFNYDDFARKNTPFKIFYENIYSLHKDDGLFPIFVDRDEIRIEKKKIFASPQLMEIFQLLMDEIPEALSKITVKDNLKIDSGDTQLTNIELEIIEAQKNLIDSLKKRGHTK